MSATASDIALLSTAYAPVRGIIVFTTTTGSDSTLWYSNLHTGNIDDLAHASSDNPSFQTCWN